MSFWSECPDCGKRYMTAGGHVCKQVRDTGLPPLLQSPPKPPNTKASRAQERAVAKECGGRVVIASGALPGSGGDVTLKDYLVECKTTGAKQYTLTKATWKKIMGEALLAGKLPLMQLDIDGTRLAVISYATLLELLEKCEQC